LVVDNGIVSVTLSKPEGYLIGISYDGIDNILESEYKEHARGYVSTLYETIVKIKFEFKIIYSKSSYKIVV